MRRAVVIGAFVVAIVCSVAVSPANAADPDPAKPVIVDGNIVVQPLDGVKDSRPAAPEEDSLVPDAIHEALWRMLVAGALDNVNGLSWNEKAGRVEVYTTDSRDAVAKAADAAGLAADAWTLVPAVNSKRDVDAYLQAIESSGGALSEGTRVVTAGASLDGSTISIGVEGSVADAQAQLARPGGAAGFDVVIDIAPEVEAATRAYSSASFRFGGAYMELAAGGACTTGFTIGKFSNGARGMMAADHCGVVGTGSPWYYGVNNTTTDEIAAYSGMLTISSTATVDLGLWFGGGTAAFYPYVFTGDYVDVSTLSAVKGTVLPVVNDKVCYSGSRSGRVCSNTVQLVNQLVCYTVTQCYGGQTITHQDANIEAAGNGDSGGPVYASVSGKLYAAGIVSGMIGGSTTCTGDPGVSGSRICSPTAIMAPVSYGLGSATGWGMIVVP